MWYLSDVFINKLCTSVSSNYVICRSLLTTHPISKLMEGDSLHGGGLAPHCTTFDLSFESLTCNHPLEGHVARVPYTLPKVLIVGLVRPLMGCHFPTYRYANWPHYSWHSHLQEKVLRRLSSTSRSSSKQYSRERHHFFEHNSSGLELEFPKCQQIFRRRGHDWMSWDVTINKHWKPWHKYCVRLTFDQLLPWMQHFFL